LKKKKKRKPHPSLLSAQPGLPTHLTHPAPTRFSLSIFLFFALTDTRARSSVSLPSPSFSSSPCLAGLPPQPQDPAAPRLLPFLFLPIKLAN
jgi:hypothetical protein